MEETYEKAILVGCQREGVEDERFAYSMEELESLTETAGGKALVTISQKRVKPHPATYIGKGKVDELIPLIEELEPDVVIFNDELSPSQIRNLGKELGVRIVDRTQLILDIFAQRARSREGQMQVELAQLQYMLPRLAGQGTELSRLGGGIGTRGPGETKLESDRRHIRRRVDEIKRQLEAVVKHRERYRARRKRNNRFQMALAGYTNAGKSTLFNKLSEADSYEENQLFATLDPMTRECMLPSGYKILISDTVGFIQDLPTSLVAAFRSTLEEVTESDAIMHVVDSSHPDAFGHEETVQKIIKDLGAEEIPQLIVYNKRDIADPGFVPTSREKSIHISARKDEDIDTLLAEMEKMVESFMEPYAVMIPAREGKLISRLQEETIVKSRVFNEANETYAIEGLALSDHAIMSVIKNYE